MRTKFNNKKFKIFLEKYFDGISIPKISSGSKKILVEEITRMVEILVKHPTISYSDLWDKIHEM